MKTVIIELPDKYSDILTFTCVGVINNGYNHETYVSVNCIDLNKCTHVKVNNDGKMEEFKIE